MMRPTLRRRDPTRWFAPLGLAALLAAGALGYISYNALSGLPFQPQYRVSVEVPDADRLIENDDVRIGGVRVGLVTRIVAEPAHASAVPYARLELGLDPSLGRLPIDTQVRVRPASVLGATYVQLTLGHGRQTIPDGGTLPLSRARNTVDLTDFFNVFDKSAGRSFQAAMSGLAGGFGGRGSALNSTIGSISTSLPPLTDVSAALAAPNARMAEFLQAFASSGNALAPVSDQLGELVSGGAGTFDALARERSALVGMIDAAPPAESAATVAFQSVRPALDGLAQLTRQLEPAGRLLPSALSVVNPTLTAGVTPLRQLPAFTGYLRRALLTLSAISHLPSTTGALRKLSDLMASLDQTLAALTPAQVHCNVIGLFAQGYSSLFGGLGVGQGPSFSNLGVSGTGAQTDSQQSARPSPDLHVNYLPIENASQCTSGNEPYTPGTQDLSNPAGPLPDHTRATYPPPGVLAHARAVGLLDPGSP